MKDKKINIFLAIEENIKVNKYIYSTFIIIILFYAFRYSRNKLEGIVNGFFSFFIAMIIGYFMHIYSHSVSHTNLYLQLYKSNTIISKLLKSLPVIIHKFNLYILYYFYDFHKNIHHNSNINKIWYNVLLEFIQNILTQSIFLIMLNLILNPRLYFMGMKIKLINLFILIWGFMYATVHLINYELYPSKSHIEHHQNYKYNLGLLFEDIIFKSQLNKSFIENYNHTSINLITISIIFFIFIELNTKSNLFILIKKYLY